MIDHFKCDVAAADWDLEKNPSCFLPRPFQVVLTFNVYTLLPVAAARICTFQYAKNSFDCKARLKTKFFVVETS